MEKYQWTTTADGQRMLLIAVKGRYWNYGSLVLDSLKRHLERNSSISIEAFLELEKEHFSHIEMRDLTEEFEILKQVPEFQKLINTQ